LHTVKKQKADNTNTIANMDLCFDCNAKSMWETGSGDEQADVRDCRAKCHLMCWNWGC